MTTYNHEVVKSHCFEVALCSDVATPIYIHQDKNLERFLEGKERMRLYPSRAIYIADIVARNKEEAIKTAKKRMIKYKKENKS